MEPSDSGRFVYRSQSLSILSFGTFTAVTRVQIPSGTPNLFKELERQSRFVAGTKGNSRTAEFLRPAVPELHFPRFDGFSVGTKRHNLTPRLRTPLRERETSELRHCELRVSVLSRPACTYPW